ncbi:hypothetical protein [Cryobacterium sp. AP23]
MSGGSLSISGLIPMSAPGEKHYITVEDRELAVLAAEAAAVAEGGATASAAAAAASETGAATSLAGAVAARDGAEVALATVATDAATAAAAGVEATGQAESALTAAATAEQASTTATARAAEAAASATAATASAVGAASSADTAAAAAATATAGAATATAARIDAEAAAAAALAVGASTDEQLEAILADPESAARGELTATIATSRTAAYMDLANKAAGALNAAHVTDSGHPYTLTVGTTGQPGYIVADGALDAVSGLAYLNTGPLPGPVRDFRMQVKWENTGFANDRPAVMIVAQTLFHPVSGSGVYANAAAHVLIYRNRWIFQKRAADGTSTNLASYTYPTGALPFGAWQDVRMTWDGQQAAFTGGDGITYTLPYDAEVAAWWGPNATVETVSSSTENRVLIRKWSADTKVDVRIPAVASASAPLGAGKFVKAPATSSTALSLTAVVVESFTIVVPASQTITVWAMPNISCAGDGIVYGTIDVGGHPTSVFSTALIENRAWDGAFTFMGICDLSPFAVGATATVNVKLTATGTATVRKGNSGPPRRTPVHVQAAAATFV